MRWRRSPGVQVEALGGGWVAFCALSGETLLLNDEGAAVLEVLHGPALGEPEICAELAVDAGLTVDELTPLIAASLPRLAEAGLVRSE